MKNEKEKKERDQESGRASRLREILRGDREKPLTTVSQPSRCHSPHDHIDASTLDPRRHLTLVAPFAQSHVEVINPSSSNKT